MRNALEDITVLDMTRVLAGPYCGMLLADLGANVIKIETPDGGDSIRGNIPKVNGESGYFMAVNRNKKGMTINLKTQKGKEIFLKLVEKADVVLENFRPGVMDRLGLGYEQLKKVNPRIIYGAISGFGQTGPLREQAGYDIIGQAMSGLMSCTGWPDTPPTRCGAPIGDTEAGMNCAIGILAALHNRDFTGEGQMIDVSLVDAMISSLITLNMRYLNGNLLPHRTGNRYENLYPYDAFKTKDGFVVFSANTDKHWEYLCEFMGTPELIDDPRTISIAARLENHEMIQKVIEKWTMTKTVKEVIDLLSSKKMAVAEILSIDQVCRHPHMAGARNMFIEMDHPVAGKVKITNNAIKMSGTPTNLRIPSPTLGQHNEEILMSLGYSREEIAQMKENHEI